jgi:TonB-linked SusC/RagA family outer membrane protein
MNRRGGSRVYRSFVCLTLFGGLWSIPLQSQAVATASQSPMPSEQLERRATAQQTRRVTVELSNVSVQAAVDRISKIAGVPISYSADVIDTKRLVSLSVSNVTVEEALRKVFPDSSIRFVQSRSGDIVITRRVDVPKGSVQPGNGGIKGRVTDSVSGQGIAGVSVTIDRSSRSVVTDRQGNFTISNVAPGEYQVTVKLFGYRSRSRLVVVGSDSTVTVNFVLAPVATVLSDVVTTATGRQRKVEIGNSITTINVDSIMSVAPISSVTDLLETRVPGLVVMRSSGIPGDPSRIRIRGSSSMTRSNDPIVIVDGVRVYAEQSDPRNQNLAPGRSAGDHFSAPSPLDQIDPSTIETIDVFKGPSAAAMYGSDAANGVIVIRTKRGRSGPTRWDIMANYGISSLPGKYPEGVYYLGHSIAGGETRLCQRDDPLCIVDSIVRFQALNEDRFSPLERGHTSRLQATVSGGVPTLQYSLSGALSNNNGILRLPPVEVERYRKFNFTSPPKWMRQPDRFTTWSGSASLTSHLSSQASVTLISMLQRSFQERSSLENRAISTLLQTYIDRSQLAREPLLTRYYERVKAQSLSSTTSLQFNWQPFSWLPLTSTVGLNTINRQDDRLIPRGLRDEVNGEDTLGFFGFGRGNSLQKTFNVGTIIPVTKVQMSLASGLNAVMTSTADVTGSTSELPPGVSSPSLFPKDKSSVGQSTSEATTFGWYLEPRFNIQSRFFILPGFRLDQNGMSGSRAKFNGFPKINLSWLVSDEEYFPFKNIFDLLRFRLAFGYAGTQPGPEDRLRLYHVGPLSTYSVGSGYSVVDREGIGASIQRLGNTKLQPERTAELEGGFEADVWRNRLHFDLTLFRKTKRDAIVPITIAPSVNGGYGNNVNINIGTIRNTGVEVSLDAQIIEHRNFGWRLGAQITHNNSIVTKINPQEESFVLSVGQQSRGHMTRIVRGYPLFGRWAKPILGYFDMNRDGIIDASEVWVGDSLIYIGRQEPNYTTAITSSLVMGRLSVNVVMNYEDGLTTVNQSLPNYQVLFGNDPNSSLGQQAAVAAYSASTSPGKQTAYGFIQTVSTFRVNSLSFNYAIDPAIARKLRARTLSVAVMGNNVALRSNYRGKDPNVNAFPYGNTIEDRGQIPQPRTWSLQLRFGF